MLLTETNIIHYLLGNGLGDTGAFVKGHYSCRSSKGRHRHFIINKEFGRNKIFVKQAELNSAEKTDSLLREGLFYHVIKTDKGFNGLKPYLPAVMLYDEKHAVIAFEYYAACINLYDWLNGPANSGMINKVAGLVANALFSLHNAVSPEFLSTNRSGLFPPIKPWILSIQESKEKKFSSAKSTAEQQSLELIFSVPGFEELISKAAQHWEASCTVHGDCKLNNFLLYNQKNTAMLKWIDWEIVATGDPLWDVATVFQSTLTAWTLSHDPLYQSGNNKNSISTGVMQQFISLTWKKYSESYNWDNATEKVKLEKCTAFTAMRLLHSCFETTPGADNLQPYSARLLQLAHNILTDPAAAYEKLLGIQLK